MSETKPAKASGLARTVAEVACRLDAPCPCCDGMETNGHDSDCTYEDECPDDCAELEDAWDMVRDLRAALRAEAKV